MREQAKRVGTGDCVEEVLEAHLRVGASKAPREHLAVLDAPVGKGGRLDAYESEPRHDGRAEPFGQRRVLARR